MGVGISHKSIRLLVSWPGHDPHCKISRYDSNAITGRSLFCLDPNPKGSSGLCCRAGSEGLTCRERVTQSFFLIVLVEMVEAALLRTCAITGPGSDTIIPKNKDLIEP
jgi:hypothetical protein